MPRAVAVPLSVAVSGALVTLSTVALVAHGASAATPSRSRVEPAGRVRADHVAIHARQVGAARAAATARGVSDGAKALPAARNGAVSVTVSGNRAKVAAQARRLGGRVLAGANGQSTVLIAKSRLDALSTAPGVGAVRAPVRAQELAVTSQGVHASGADTWQNGGDTGAGVQIAIVDAGFAGYQAEATAGNLPTGQTVINKGCTVNGQPNVNVDEHGTAVAEIVHQMAPDATLVLYCIADNVGFADAEQDILANHPQVRVVSSSLGFPGDSRGDGTGDVTSAAATVKDARKHGLLWVQSAGNNAVNHWSGMLTDADKDGLIDLDGVYNPDRNQYEVDEVYLQPGSPSSPSSMSIELQWDQWPTSGANLSLTIYGYRCTTNSDTCDPVPLKTDSKGNPAPYVIRHTSGDSPFIEFDPTNTTSLDAIYDVYVSGTAYPSTRYDLSYEGAVDGPSLLACNPDSAGSCHFSSRAYSGSITSPASSPYAFSVGAADVGNDGTSRGTLEPFSSRGPTIDGRVKPDILGWDGVSSNLDEFSGGFYGTSAAAPHVAGAAALVAAADPALDASQIQAVLEQRANSGSPLNPPDYAHGHGLLTLGDPSTVAAPAGANYQPLAPTRLLDTRSSVGNHQGRLGAGGTITLSIPSLPSDATAVAINLTGVAASASTYLAAYPGGTAYPGTSNVNLKPRTDATAAVFAVVTVKNKSITIRNQAGTVDVLVDELGYFGTNNEPNRYVSLSAPQRVTNNVALAPRGHVTVDPNLPSDATAAVVNVTTASTTASGYVGAAPACTGSISTLNFAQFSRANLAVVQLDPSGNFCVTDGPSAAHLFVDVVGYMSSGGGAQYVALPSAQRIVDTRNGNGGNAGGRVSKPLAGGTTTQFYAAGVGDVPARATALLTSVVEAGNDRGGYLSLFAGVSPPASSTVNYSPGRVVANAAITGVSGGNFAVYARIGSTQAAVDVFGYFLVPNGCGFRTPC